MNPKQFLVVGGVVLLLLGILGYLTGTPTGGPLDLMVWLTSGENIAHVVLGIVALIAAYTLGGGARKWLTVIVGLVALYFGLVGFTLAPTQVGAMNYYGVANLELFDNLLHIVVAVWAFWAASRKEMMM
ncbi:MAG: hypothetical protein V4674_03825 [Patescibacteria group bacterium]